MSETRRRFDLDFKEGAVRIVVETGKPIAQVARELGINPGTLADWVALQRHRQAKTDDLRHDHSKTKITLRDVSTLPGTPPRCARRSASNGS